MKTAKSITQIAIIASFLIFAVMSLGVNSATAGQKYATIVTKAHLSESQVIKTAKATVADIMKNKNAEALNTSSKLCTNNSFPHFEVENVELKTFMPLSDDLDTGKEYFAVIQYKITNCSEPEENRS